MIQKVTLDQLPSNVKIVEQSGLPTQAFVFYLLKMFRKANIDLLNFDSLQTQVTEVTLKQVSVNADYTTPEDGNYTIHVDANSGPVSVRLPLPKVSKRLAIGKIDLSENEVTIVPHGTELVAGEGVQTLLCDGEVLEFVSDGINWYVGG